MKKITIFFLSIFLLSGALNKQVFSASSQNSVQNFVPPKEAEKHLKEKEIAQPKEEPVKSITEKSKEPLPSLPPKSNKNLKQKVSGKTAAPKRKKPAQKWLGVQIGYVQLDSDLPLKFPNTRFFGVSVEVNYMPLWQFGKFFFVGPDVFFSYMGSKNLLKTKKYFDMAIHVLALGVGPLLQFSLHRTTNFYLRSNLGLGVGFIETVIFVGYPPALIWRVLPGFRFNLSSKIAFTIEGGYVGAIAIVDEQGKLNTLHGGQISLGVRMRM